MTKKAFTTMTVSLLVGAFACLLAGCGEYNTSDSVIQQQQEASMQEAVRQTGLPAIGNYHEKKMLKMLYELRDQADLVCYAYLFNEREGKIGQYLGKCIGYGLPASTQYSNPQKIVRHGGSGLEYYRGPMPQAEPNGLFMPEGLSATWLMMLDKSGEAKPVYIEPAIIVSPFPLSSLDN
jgi:hypothetical protein